MYLDKKELRDLLIEYQDISEDTDDSWLANYKKFPRKKLVPEGLVQFEKDRENFKAYRYKQYAEKRKRIAAESKEQTLVRIERADRLKTLIARDFFKIIDGTILLYEFQSKSDNNMKDDMRSEAIWIMYNYIPKYDVRKPNPFSYFTEMAKNAFRHVCNNSSRMNLKRISSDFIENMDDERDDEWYES